MVNEMVLFESADGSVKLDAEFDGSTVWLTKDQIGLLFERNRTVISRHISNIYKEQELEREGTCAKNAQVQIEGSRKVTRYQERYNLDVIISVGYRVKSQRGVEFRRWATDVLRRYIVDGHAENARRLEQLGQVARVMTRISESLETRQVLVKNHSFHDGNKRIAATMFLYFLDRNNALFDGERKMVDDSTLLAAFLGTVGS